MLRTNPYRVRSSTLVVANGHAVPLCLTFDFAPGSMSEQLYRAILDNLSDDGPRLVYADWLEENGQEERADFIRVQCSLASDELDSDQRKKLTAREQELLSKYAWDWAEEYGKSISEWQFERGFITRAQLDLERDAEPIIDIVNRGTITHLRDTGQFCELEGFVEALPKLHPLTGLEFWGLYAFSDQLVAEMLQSPQLAELKTLVLHHDRNGNLVDEQVIVDAMKSPLRSNIEVLAVNVDCSWRGASNAILKAVAESPYLRNLKRLDLSNAGNEGNNPQLTVEVVEQLAASPNLQNLEILDLRSVHTLAEVWQAILQMPQLRQLKKLYLKGACEIPPGEWIPIVGWLNDLPRWSDQFNSLGIDIDWETTFIDWANEGGDYWSGHSWESRRRSTLFDIAQFLSSRL